MTQTLQLHGFLARRLEHISRLEQPHILAAAIQVVGQHVEHAGHHRSPHDGGFVADRIREFDRRRRRKPLRIFMRNERQRNSFVVAEREQ